MILLKIMPQALQIMDFGLIHRFIRQDLLLVLTFVQQIIKQDYSLTTLLIQLEDMDLEFFMKWLHWLIHVGGLSMIKIIQQKVIQLHIGRILQLKQIFIILQAGNVAEMVLLQKLWETFVGIISKPLITF